MFYSKPITGLTIYLRWKRLFLFVRLNILNGPARMRSSLRGPTALSKNRHSPYIHRDHSEAARQHYLHEAEHMRERVALLEQAITETSNRRPTLQQVINDLQVLPVS